MRRLALLVVLAVVVGGAVYIYSNLPTASTAVVGAPAPDFKLTDTKGNQVALADLRGKVVLVNLWATWCPPCIEEMPSMEKLNQLMAGEDFVMLAVNAEKDGRTVVPAFLKKTPYNFTILYDDEAIVQALYGVYKFPESFIIRKDGTIAEKIIGPINWASPKTIDYLKSLTRG